MQSRQPPTRPIRLLLADDDPLVIRHLGSILNKQEELELVATAGNGAQAIAQASLHTIDVALIDVDMPVLDGLQTAKALASTHPHIAIVMLTAFEHKQSLAAALQRGVRGFLTKDIATKDMVEQIKLAFDGYTVLGPKPTQILTSTYLATQHASTDFAGFVDAVNHLPSRFLPVFEAMTRGLTNKRIAQELGLSEATVRTYASHILQLTNTHNRGELAFTAAKAGMMHPARTDAPQPLSA
ncbi:MAG: response regulator transcription factor [Actinomycetaceae bacterium]|nr:response regulator transcription factor [Actinomycetaceae bacterium]MDY6083447.1 response regulator transcription factor [Actinomycetaceae bacterium]